MGRHHNPMFHDIDIGEAHTINSTRMNKNRNLIHLVGILYSFNYITKESFFIEIIAKENFISKFLVILLKLLYSLFRDELSKKSS